MVLAPDTQASLPPTTTIFLSNCSNNRVYLSNTCNVQCLDSSPTALVYTLPKTPTSVVKSRTLPLDHNWKQPIPQSKSSNFSIFLIYFFWTLGAVKPTIIPQSIDSKSHSFSSSPLVHVGFVIQHCDHSLSAPTAFYTSLPVIFLTLPKQTRSQWSTFSKFLPDGFYGKNNTNWAKHFHLQKKTSSVCSHYS